MKDYDVTIIYFSRKSISIEGKMDGILVRAPKRMSRRAIDTVLEEKQN